MIKVGMAVSLSGRFASLGAQTLEGVFAWVGDVTEAGGIYLKRCGERLPISFKHYDDQGKSDIVKALTERLIVDDEVDILLGPYSSGLTLAAASVAEGFQKVLWNHGGASDEIHNRGFSWVVSVLTPASKYMMGVLDLVRDVDPSANRIALLYPRRGPFFRAIVSGVEAYAKHTGFKIVYRGEYDSPVDNFSPLLSEFKLREPDVVIGAGFQEDDLLSARELVAERVETKAVALVAAPTAQFRESLGVLVNGFLGPSQWEPGIPYQVNYGPSPDEAWQKLKARRAHVMDYPMAQAYAAGLIAQRCIEEAGVLDNSMLREKASQLTVTTFYGPFQVDPTTGCQVGHSVVIIQWQKGQKVIVWPKELRQSPVVYPLHY